MDNFRTYRTDECVSFRKTNEEFGGLSNMAGGYPIVVNGINIRTSEALYQAMRFPDYPEIQKEIIEQKSPMTAKMVAKKYRASKTRSDWDQKRIAIMKWSIRVKLIQNKDTFGKLLLQTKDLPIVEMSHKDQFWGAKLLHEGVFEGTNALGRLLMELREFYKTNESCKEVAAPNVKNFKLYGLALENTTATADKDQFIAKDKDRLF